jgi:hypothetical protein
LKGKTHGCQEKSREEEVLQEKNREKEVVEKACSKEEIFEEEVIEEESGEEEIGKEEIRQEEEVCEAQAREEAGGEAQARDGRGTDEAHGPGGHPGHHAADQADELIGRLTAPRANRLDPNTRRDPTGAAQAARNTAG